MFCAVMYRVLVRGRDPGHILSRRNSQILDYVLETKKGAYYIYRTDINNCVHNDEYREHAVKVRVADSRKKII